VPPSLSVCVPPLPLDVAPIAWSTYSGRSDRTALGRSAAGAAGAAGSYANCIHVQYVLSSIQRFSGLAHGVLELADSKCAMPQRPDMSPDVTHLIRARDDDEAFVKMLQILECGCLKGSNATTRGGFHTISFSETPLCMMARPLLDGAYYYRPFGVQVSKKWLFPPGGRNVAYQTAEEFDELPETHKWRHVRYEPHVENGVDFHWEREWRVNAVELAIDPYSATLIVPTGYWHGRLEQYAESEQDVRVHSFAQTLGGNLAEAYRESFQWRVVTVESAL
jgi:hypothetical protein